MLDKSKIVIFNNVANAIKYLIILILGLLTISFFIFPSFEVFVKDKLLQKDYCFYVGTWDITTKRFTKPMYDLKDSDYIKETGQIKNGIVLFATATEIIGRTDFGTNAGIRKYVGGPGDCLLVLESRKIKIPEYENKFAVWVRALPEACE